MTMLFELNSLHALSSSSVGLGCGNGGNELQSPTGGIGRYSPESSTRSSPPCERHISYPNTPRASRTAAILATTRPPRGATGFWGWSIPGSSASPKPRNAPARP